MDLLLSTKYNEKSLIKNFYENSDYLYKSEIDFSRKLSSQINLLEFSKCGTYLATGDNYELFVWRLDNINSNLNLDIVYQNKTFSSSLVFDNFSSKIIYGGGKNYYPDDNHLYIIDIKTNKKIKELKVFDNTKDISFNPLNDNLFSFSTFKTIKTFDLRTSTLKKLKIKNLISKPYFNSIQYHPSKEYLMLISAESKEIVFSLDTRNGQIIDNYKLPNNYKYDILYAKYNRKGDKILVTSRNFNPILFNFDHNHPVFEFDHFGFDYNYIFSQCCFAGLEDEFIVSSSNDSNVYMWKIPNIVQNDLSKNLTKKINYAKHVLKGHTSIVNNVKYNYEKSILSSFGYDQKLIFWSPFPLYSDLAEIKTSKDLINEKNISYKDSSFINLVVTEYFLTNNFHFTYLKFEFDFELKRIFKIKNKNLELEFHENPSIFYIKSLIFNFIINNGKEINLSLIKRFENFLINQNIEDMLLSIQHSSFLFEVKKVFETKNLIKNLIIFLNFLLNLSNKTKRKLDYLKKKSESVELNRKIKLFNNIKIAIKSMINDLIVIYKSNQKLYEISFQIIEKLLKRFDYFKFIPSLKLKLLENLFEKKINEFENLDLDFSIQKTNDTKLNINEYYSSENLNKLKSNIKFKQNFKTIKKFLN